MPKFERERFKLVALAAVAGCLLALAPAARAVDVTSAREVRFPQAPHRVGPYYPERASGRAKGSAEIACHVGANGALNDCYVVRETGEWGFGEASLIMARRHWIVATPKADGSPETPETLEHFVVKFDF